MLIIVEGPDGAGKTTLVKKLVATLCKAYPDDAVMSRHARPPRNHPLDEYVLPLASYQPRRGLHVVCDRWHWGERVYPEAMKRPTFLDDAVFYYVELFLQSRGAIVVHATANVDELIRRVEERGDDFITPDQLPDLRRSFFATQKESILNGTIVHSPDHDLDERVDSIIHVADSMERAAALLNSFVTYVGHPNPRLLLLGDVRNVVPDKEGGLGLGPAFMPYRATSGYYLMRALTKSVFKKELKIGIANACDVDDPAAIYEQLGHPQVVTLGGHARNAFPLRARHAPHPQYVRRFHSKRVEDYFQQLIYGAEIAWN